MDANRLTEKAREAIVAARELAARGGQQQIEPEHLLLALLEQENGVAPAILAKANVELTTLRDRAQREAQVVIAFVLDRTGRVLSATIAQSSGDASFDQAALAMMRRADPVPAPPALVADEGLSFSLPVNFRAQRRK